MAQPLEIVFILKKPSIHDHTAQRFLHQEQSRQLHLQHLCSLRLKIIDWLIRAQLLLKMSRVTFFLAISMLDRLILRHYPLNDETHELVAGSLIMTAAKFNEVNPPSPRKLNQLLTCDLYRAPEEFVQTEGSILQALDFNLSDDFNFYERLAQIEHFGPDNQRQRRHLIVQAAISNGVLFRFGHEVLKRAVQTVIRGQAMTPHDSFFDQKQRQMVQIQSELFAEFSSKSKKVGSHFN